MDKDTRNVQIFQHVLIAVSVGDIVVTMQLNCGQGMRENRDFLSYRMAMTMLMCHDN